MIQLPNNSVHDEIVRFVRHWFKLIATGQSHLACNLIDQPNRYGMSWNPERIQQTIEGIFPPKSRFISRHPEGLKWSDPDNLAEGGHPNLITLKDGSGYQLDHDIPLNGEWSDVTIQFEFQKHSDGYAVILHDIHVL